MAEKQMPEKPAGLEPHIRKMSGRPTKTDKPPARRAKGRDRTKPPFRKQDADGTHSGSKPPRREQTPRKPRGAPPEWYVRFRVRAEDGEIRVLDSHAVEGPLVETTVLDGNFAYEVTLGDLRLHSESIPDLGVARSFASPDGPVELRQHHIRELPRYDFNVRVPSQMLKARSLTKIEITLYRVKDRSSQRASATTPLRLQFQQEVRPIARLSGIPREFIPKRFSRKRS